ncbi:MAG: polysaccharide biosynthesis C-terminal domain-containing protein [Planctomycetota bacterium]
MASRGGLSKHTLIYAVGNIINRAVSFILIPLYTYRLSRADYGVLEMADVTVALLAQLLGFGIGGAMVRFYFDTEDELTRKRLAATTQLFFAAFLGIVTFGLGCFAPTLSPLVFGRGDFDTAFRLAMAILFLTGVGEVPLSLMKAERRSTLFISLALSKLVFEVGLKVYLIVVLEYRWYGALFGSVVAWSVFATLPALWLLRRTGFHFAPAVVKRLVLFCSPLIISGVASFALHSADRFMLRSFFPGDAEESRGEVGIYALAYRLGYVMNFLILDPFLLIWFPFIFAIKNEAEQKHTIARAASYVVAAMVFGSLALAIGARDVVALMASPEYATAGALVPIVLLGYVFWAAYQLIHTPLFILKRTGRLPLIVGIAAATNIGLNALWIPRWGAAGAAWATVIAFALLAVVAFRFVRRLFVVRYEWARLCLPLALAIGIFVAFEQVRPAALLPRLALAALAILSFPLILGLSGFVRRDEWLRVSELWHTIRSRWPPGSSAGSTPSSEPRSGNRASNSEPATSVASVPVSHDR